VLAAAVAAAVIVVALVILAVAILVAAAAPVGEAFLDDGGKHFEFVLIRGNEVLLIPFDHDLHDVNIVRMLMLMFMFMLVFIFVFLILALFGKIHEHGVFLTLILEIINDIQLELLAVVIREGHKIPFFHFHRVYRLSVTVA
jgi:hypothetical protein